MAWDIKDRDTDIRQENSTDAAAQSRVPATLEGVEKLVCEDLARSGLTQEDVHGLKVVGLEAMKPLPGSQDDLPDEGGEGYDPDEYDDDETTDLSDKFEAAGGYVIPYFSLYAKPIREQGRKFQRVRLVGRKNDDVPRYRSPRGSSNHVYVPQGLRDLLVRIARQRKIVPDVDILYITEGEKKAIRSVKAGTPCIALPGVTMWSDSAKVRAMKRDYEALGGDPSDIHMTEDTPVNPELLEVIEQIKALCPSIGVVGVLFDSDGKPVSYKDAYTKTKSGLVPNGGVNWLGCDVPGKSESFVSANPQVTSAGYTLAAALRKQMPVRAVVSARFCAWDDSDEDLWRKQGLDDWLQAEPYPGSVAKRLRGTLAPALRLWDVVQNELLFNCSADPDALGVKGGPSAEIAFSRMLDGNVVGQADGLLFQWLGSHWQKVDQLRLERAAHRLLDAFYEESGSARKIGDAPKLAVSAPHLFPIPEPLTKHDIADAIIPCADVTLDIGDDGAIVAREPRKGDGLRYCVNAKWADRNQPCPLFLKFIESTLPDAQVRGLVQQYIGYTLIGDTRHDTAQWWFGSGANGKSVLADIVGALHRQVAAVGIEDMGGFQSEGLIGASLISVDETPKRVDEQRLKAYISGGIMSIDRKYNMPVSVNLSAKWLLRGNEKPVLTDHTDGLWRRLHIIHFEQKFVGKDKDPLLLEKILKNEMPGVLNWAIEGLVKVLKANGFVDVPDCVWAWKREMQAETNSVLGWWMDKEIGACDAPRAIKDHVYANYNTWCRTNGLVPAGSTVFWRRLRSIMDEKGTKLVDLQETVTLTDPFTGETERKRVRKVNLDLDGPPADDEASDNVIPMRRPAASTEAPTTAPDTAPVATGFVELDEPKPDAVVDVVVTDEQLLPALDVPPDKGAPPYMGKALIIPSFPAQALGTIQPIKNPTAKGGIGGAK